MFDENYDLQKLPRICILFIKYCCIKVFIVETFVCNVFVFCFFLPCIGFYDPSAARNMLKECSKMYNFKHPNVLTLCGVCLDGGPAPYIIMPFMANGSLLAYLKRNKGTLIVSCENNDNNDGEVWRDFVDTSSSSSCQYISRIAIQSTCTS